MAVREDNNGYKFTGETSDRLWGKFISYNFSQTLSTAWKNAPNAQTKIKNFRHNRKPTTVKRDKKTNSSLSALPIPQRHCAIASVLSQLSITAAHRKALIKRGFTDRQILQYGFKSVRYKQPLTKTVDNRLAGVAKNGKHLTNKFSGLIVPASSLSEDLFCPEHCNQHNGNSYRKLLLIFRILLKAIVIFKITVIDARLPHQFDVFKIQP